MSLYMSFCPACAVKQEDERLISPAERGQTGIEPEKGNGHEDTR